MRVLLPTVVCCFLLTVLAGCVSDDPTVAPAIPNIQVTYAEGASTRNLIDGTSSPIPMQNTAVSSGAEPRVYSSKDGSVLWIGHSFGGYRSFDQGATWQSMSNPMLPSVFIDGWDFAEDDDGVLYGTSTGGQVQVFRSTNNGLSWEITTRFTPDDISALADRPWIDARGSGELILIYNDSGFTTHCTKSYDGGVTWPDKYHFAGSPIAGNVVFDDDGKAYYGESGGFMYRIRTGGLLPNSDCFSGFSTRQATTAVGDTLQAQVAVEDGTSYMALPIPGNNANKVVAYNWNTGASKEFEFGLPELTSNTFQTIDMKDGRIYVGWYGSETDGDYSVSSFNGWWSVYLATIDNFWSANPEVAVYTVQEDHHKGMICLGGVGCTGNADRDLLDYFGIDVDLNGKVHVAYVHDGDTTNAKVRYAGFTPA